uniref:BTB domain-containing protein n=1 Tax=Strigamia maritima TaxID=126957 RepID=T1ITF8_STRMM
MSLHMEELRRQQFGTDVVLECAEGDIHAHKNVLVASCPYFEKMFVTDMLEQNTGSVQFNNVSKNVIETIVKYLYTGETPILTEDYAFSRELIATSHMMELQHLLRNCWKQITNNLTPEKFAGIWAIGVDFGLDEEGPLEHFARKNLKKISGRANLKNLSAIQMTKLIDLVDHKRFCDACVQCILKWKSRENEQDAVKLIRQLDLQLLSGKTLSDFIKKNPNEKEESVLDVLLEESVARLPESDMYKALSEVIDINRHEQCKEIGCNAEDAIDEILAVFDDQITYE